MATSISDSGLTFADGNIISSASSMPTTGTYTSGTIILNNSAGFNVKLAGWKRLTNGSTHVLGTDWIEITAGISRGTQQNTTSGVGIDFLNIPSWAKRITVMFNGVSTNGTSLVQVQLGISSGFEATGYTSITGTNTSTTGLLIAGVVATDVRYGILTLFNMSGNIWISSGSNYANATNGGSSSGAKTLSGVLDRVRITTVNGTDTFDAGSVNIMWE